MPDPEQAVNPEESASPEQETVETAGTPAPEQTEGQEQQEQPQETGQAPIEAVDELGVPYKNRFMEMQRKHQDLAEKLPEIIETTLAKHSQQQQPQYTEEQLDAFVKANPDYSDWAAQQKRTLRQKETQDAIRSAVEEVTTKQKDEVRRQQSFQYVTQNFPQCFVKDAFGNMQWNLQNPMTSMIGQIMQDPRMKNQPDGMAIAADLAYGRMARMNLAPQNQKFNSLKRENTKLKRATLTEGGGVPSSQPSKDAFQKAKENLVKTGTRDAAHNAVKEYLKKTGRLT